MGHSLEIYAAFTYDRKAFKCIYPFERGFREWFDDYYNHWMLHTDVN